MSKEAIDQRPRIPRTRTIFVLDSRNREIIESRTVTFKGPSYDPLIEARREIYKAHEGRSDIRIEEISCESPGEAAWLYPELFRPLPFKL